MKKLKIKEFKIIITFFIIILLVSLFFLFLFFNSNNKIDENLISNTMEGLNGNSAILNNAKDYKGHWAEEYIIKAVNLNILKGTSVETLEPDGEVTRSLFTTMLKRFDNGKLPLQENYIMKFTDVNESVFLFESVKWACSNNIAQGVSETSFAPNYLITREQMMVMCYNYLKAINKIDNYKVEDTKVLSKSEYISNEWASDKVDVLNKMGLLYFYKNRDSDFRNYATRAELSCLMVNMYDFIIEE